MEQIKPAKKLTGLKNDLFIKNSKDPNNNLFVKKIWVQSEMKDTKFKCDRTKWDLRWEYYRHRGKYSVEQFLKDNIGKKIKIIYSGDPKQYVFVLDQSLKTINMI